jgi:5-methylcytosine-specific restriction endonuclease McrA
MPYKNKEDKKRNDAKWRKSNYGRMKLVDSAWHKNNKDRHAATRKKYYELLSKAEGSYTKEEWENLCSEYGNLCLCCGKIKPLEPDHIIPVSKGGTNRIDNIQPLCHSCNTSKGNRRTTDYRNTLVLENEN